MGLFHRRYGVSTVTVTFYGNGGLTSGGDGVVALETRKGTAWKDVVKPEFLQSGTVKKQNGFTFVAGDDSTAVESLFAVKGDITVYASYTVVEIGVVTHNGEVYSAAGWAARFANPDSADNLYVWTDGHAKYDSANNVFFMAGADPGNLIEFVYYRAGDRIFALRSSYTENGRQYGSLNSTDENYIPNSISMMSGAFDDIVHYPDGVTVEAGKIPSIQYHPTLGVTPADPSVLLDGKYGNGKSCMEILFQKLEASYGGAPALMHRLRQETDPFGLGETAYLGSLYETCLIVQNEDKFLGIFGMLDDATGITGLMSTPYMSTRYAAYRGVDAGNSGSGFTPVRSAILSGIYPYYGSNLYKWLGGGNVWTTCNYGKYSGTTRGGIYVRGLYLMSLEGLF